MRLQQIATASFPILPAFNLSLNLIAVGTAFGITVGGLTVDTLSGFENILKRAIELAKL